MTKGADAALRTRRDTRVRAAAAMASDVDRNMRLRSRKAEIRNGFVFRETTDDPLPPASVLHQPRVKDGVRLRVMLSLLWTAGGGTGVDPRTGARVADPHTVTFRLADMAQLVGIADPTSPGAQRRISGAIDALVSLGLISVHRREPARPLTIQLCREDRVGSGSPYFRPYNSTTKKAEPYLTLPGSFWIGGWIAALPSSALLVLLALRYMSQTRRTDEGLFVAPGLRSHFGFSEETYYRGTKSLIEYGIIGAHRVPVRRAFRDDSPSYRKAYTLWWKTLDEGPTIHKRASKAVSIHL